MPLKSETRAALDVLILSTNTPFKHIARMLELHITTVKARVRLLRSDGHEPPFRTVVAPRDNPFRGVPPRKAVRPRPINDDIARLHAEGLSDQRIAERLGRNPSTIRVRRIALGLPGAYERNRNSTRLGIYLRPKIDEALRADILAGLSKRMLMLKHGVSGATIGVRRRELRAAGHVIRLMSPGESPLYRAWRAKKDRLRPHPSVPSYGISDDLYQRVNAYVPAYENDIRRDMVQELYLAVLSGDLTLDEVAERGGAVIRRAGLDLMTVSYDHSAIDDGRAWIESIADPDWQVAFDRIDNDYEDTP